MFQASLAMGSHEIVANKHTHPLRAAAGEHEVCAQEWWVSTVGDWEPSEGSRRFQGCHFFSFLLSFFKLPFVVWSMHKIWAGAS